MLMSEYEIGVDERERHLLERLVYRDRCLGRLRFCSRLLARRQAERVEQGEVSAFRLARA